MTLRWGPSDIGSSGAVVSTEGREHLRNILVPQCRDQRKIDNFLSHVDQAVSLYAFTAEATARSSPGSVRANLKKCRAQALKLLNYLTALDHNSIRLVDSKRRETVRDSREMLLTLVNTLMYADETAQRYPMRGKLKDFASRDLAIYLIYLMRSVLEIEPTAREGGLLHSLANALLNDRKGEADREYIGEATLKEALATSYDCSQVGLFAIG